MSNIAVTPETLRDLNRSVVNEANAIDEIRVRISTTIEATDWHSPAAERFRGDWNSKYVLALNQIVAALQELGGSANTMANNYDSTENSYPSS